MQAVIYARYSSDAQREASIEDQVRLCRELAERQGWAVVEVYADHALSGASSAAAGLSAAARGCPRRAVRGRGRRGAGPLSAATRSTPPACSSSSPSPACGW